MNPGRIIASDRDSPLIHRYGRICGGCCGATSIPLNELNSTDGLLIVVEGEGPILEEEIPTCELHREVVITSEGPITVYWSTYDPS